MWRFQGLKDNFLGNDIRAREMIVNPHRRNGNKTKKQFWRGVLVSKEFRIRTTCFLSHFPHKKVHWLEWHPTSCSDCMKIHFFYDLKVKRTQLWRRKKNWFPQKWFFPHFWLSFYSIFFTISFISSFFLSWSFCYVHLKSSPFFIYLLSHAF